MVSLNLTVHAVECRILRRLRRTRGSLDGVTEFDLAWDAATETTDQDHVGGATFVGELGRAAGVVEATRVLDLCCGLGGSARFLAATRGCSVRGLDVSRRRCAAARRLNALVGLEERVSIECCDVMSAPVAEHRVDVLWGQSAWIDVPDPAGLVARWTPALGAGGRIAFEDSCLQREPRSDDQHDRLRTLAHAWHAHVVPLDTWLDAFESAGLRAERVQNLSERARDYFESRLARTAPAPPVEVAAWTTACALLEAGVLSYMRVVAVRP